MIDSPANNLFGSYTPISDPYRSRRGYLSFAPSFGKPNCNRLLAAFYLLPRTDRLEGVALKRRAALVDFVD